MLTNIEPGRYAEMDIEAYHASAGLSSSGIRLLLECPRRYWNQYLSGQFVRKNNPSFLFGSVVHTAILEPHKSISVEYPKLKGEMINAIKGILDSVQCLDVAQRLGGGYVEQSLYWEAENTLLKTRPDFFDDKCVIEIKTTKDASKDAFSKSVHEYGYHIQAAMQIDGIEAVTGNKPTLFIFIAIEKEAPFIAAAYLLGGEDIERGRKLYKKAVGIYHQCVATGKWHGYSDQLEDINMPKWAIDSDLRGIENV